MTIVASLLAVVLLAVIVLHHRQDALREQAWTEERRELLTRIQKPDMIPLRAQEAFTLPEEEPDEYDMVGHVADPIDEMLTDGG